jgi:hypothetical protein
MRSWMLLPAIGLFVAGCVGGMGGSIASEIDEPASCKKAVARSSV